MKELMVGKSTNGRLIPVLGRPENAQKHLYLLAGVHGDEVEGVYLLHHITKHLAAKNIKTPFICIPLLNPDGLAAGERVNANGVDLNRNLPTSNWKAEARAPRYYPGDEPLSEIENIFLEQVFNRYPPGLIITFHSWKPMLQTDGKRAEPIAEYLHQFNRYELVKEVIENHPTPGSLGTWAQEAYDAHVLTFECPVIEHDYEISDLLAENIEGFQKLLNHNDLIRQSMTPS